MVTFQIDADPKRNVVFLNFLKDGSRLYRKQMPNIEAACDFIMDHVRRAADRLEEEASSEQMELTENETAGGKARSPQFGK